MYDADTLKQTPLDKAATVNSTHNTETPAMKFWVMTPCYSSVFRLMNAARGERIVTHCDFLNDLEMQLARRYLGEPRPVPFPVAQLKLTREDFEVDFFTWSGRLLVSERLRQVMALKSSEARFFEVDASQSAPLPRAKNYCIMEPTAVDDVTDRGKSVYRLAWPIPGSKFSLFEVDRIVTRPEAAPKHKLFYDRFFRAHLMCSETFAMRVLRAGCTGVRFVDPKHMHRRSGTPPRYRTLRGIEEHVEWDFKNRAEITRLVKTIS